MKRILFVFLLIASLLAACGSPATQLATSRPAETQVPAKPAETQPVVVLTEPVGAASPVEISYMMWGAPEELEVWQKLVDQFEKENPDIKVNVDVSDWDAYWTKLNTMVAGGTPPDVFAMDAPLYMDWQSRGALLNLQSCIDSTPGFLDGFYPQTLQAYKLDDGYYGLPRDFQTIVLFYNKDMFDAAKLPYPTASWTMDDLRQAAKKLTIDKNNDGKIEQFGFAPDLWDMELFWSEAIWANGGEIISPDHTKTLIGEPKAREAWQFMADMMHTDKSIPDPNTAGQYGGDLFQAGVAAMIPIGHWAVPGYAQSGIKFDVAPMPKGAAGQATSVNSAGFVVSKDTKNPEATCRFLKYALSDQGQTLLTELGFAIPVRKSIAESPIFLQQKGTSINQQVFLDSLAFARMKPVFRGYEEWSSVVGDGLTPVWNGEAELNPTLDQIVTQADAVLAQNK